VKKLLLFFSLLIDAWTNIYYDSTNPLVKLKGYAMRLKASIVKVLLYRIVVVALAWMIMGCGSKSAPFPTYMQPELLYLKHQPYSRLYVEIDAVEGVEVPDQWLDELKAFLDKYCEKPDGIEIVQDPPIPLSEIKGMSIGAASILCLDGPDTISIPQAAYLHVFFYDKNVGFKTEIKESPHVQGYCPCGILFNVSYFRISKGKAEEFALKHELGHVLGLCKNPKHSDGLHCKNQECLMYKEPGLLPSFGLLFGSRVEKQLCTDCQRDLETWKSGDIDPKLSFKGPFLMRCEDGYSAASLPYCHFIIPNPIENTFEWTELLSFLKDKIREKHRAALKEGHETRERNWLIRGYWGGSFNKEVPFENAPKHKAILLRKAAEDPCPLVKNYANFALRQLKKEQ
jgi:hypothetical protein